MEIHNFRVWKQLWVRINRYGHREIGMTASPCSVWIFLG